MKKKRNSSSKSTGTAESTSAAPDSPMNVKLLEQMVKLMAANDLNTVDVRDGEKRVILKRGAVIAQVAPTVSAAAPRPAAASAPAEAPPTNGDEADANLKPIKSPMVGTFYTASSPEAKPFVSVGSTVDEDTDVCIIEAMKVFNNIKAETSGTIAKILVTNGQTVEFGQTLFLVKP